MALLRREDVEPKDHKEAPEPEPGAILGKGSRFEGKLGFDGTVRIDGEFKGDIVSDGKLVVGDNAHIDGNVSVGVAVVSGTLTGTLKAKTLVELKPHARVHGEITTASLVIERGAQFDGTVKMTKA
jgi:cytoskeletal protein CcmA (bactofilin family)